MCSAAQQGARASVPLKSILLHLLSDIEDKATATSDHYEQEFQDLKRFSETLNYSCSEGEKPINKKKNRYKDILPFDVTRVVLHREGDAADGSDYINANYIKGASGSPAYIASQGPLPNTLVDFWRMIVQCQVQVIVMACNPHEAGKHKCENYWVEKEGETRTFGCVEIRLIKANTVCSDYLVRTMLITFINDKSIKESRTVCQFHYLAWPDHGVPPLVRPLLDMVRLVRDTQASETLPVLVHCSAGCGRTGTICAIDFVWGLARLGKMSKDFNVFNLIRDMRRQRVAMVQTKEQYVLVHQAVGELLKQQLQIIRSHHYENIDVNGAPLTFDEPIYETIGSRSTESQSQDVGTKHSTAKESSTGSAAFSRSSANIKIDHLSPTESVNNYCIEKEDRNKLEYELSQDFSEASIHNTPPLPKKRLPNTFSSKQAKEVENLTEKNRRAAAFKSIADESADNTLKSRPKIAKLRALFERNLPSADKKNGKSKQSISRSHSLGPVRNTNFIGKCKPDEENIVKVICQSENMEPAVRSGGKLKVTPRTAPQVKRSKSLILNKQTTPFLTLLRQATEDNSNDLIVQENTASTSNQIFGKIPSPKNNSTMVKSDEPHQRVRRRSLDSISGEDLSSTPRISTQHIPKPKGGLSLRHQLQILSTVSHKTVTSLASGWSLGIRERRNSFRQAMSKDIDQFGSEGRFVYVSEDAAANSARPKLTVRSQNGEILAPGKTGQVEVGKQYTERGKAKESISEHNLIGAQSAKLPLASHEKGLTKSSQSMRLPTGNKFLYRLRSEIDRKHHENSIQPIRNQNRDQTRNDAHILVKPINSDSTDILKQNYTRNASMNVTPAHLWKDSPISKEVENKVYHLDRKNLFSSKSNEDVVDGPSKHSLYRSRTMISHHSDINKYTNYPLPVYETNRQRFPIKSTSASSHSSDNVSDYAVESLGYTEKNHSRKSTHKKIEMTSPHERKYVHRQLTPLRHNQKETSNTLSSHSDVSTPTGPKEKNTFIPLETKYHRNDMFAQKHNTLENSRNARTLPAKLTSGNQSVSPKKAMYGRKIYMVETEGSVSASESSSSSGARELESVLRPVAETSWAALTRCKSSSDAIISAGSVMEPQAPPRLRRRSSTTTPASLEKRHSSVNPQEWSTLSLAKPNGRSVGVDVDAVAASMQLASLSSAEPSSTNIQTVPTYNSDSIHFHISSQHASTTRKQQYL